MLRIVIVANCQGDLLAKGLMSVLRDKAAIDVSSLTFDQDVYQISHRVGRADVVLEQVVGGVPDLGEMLAPGARRLRFPLAQMKWLWPFSTQPHPRQNEPVPDHLSHFLPPEFCDATLNGYIKPLPEGWRERVGQTLLRKLPGVDLSPPGGSRLWPSLNRGSGPARSAADLDQTIDAYYANPPSPKRLDRIFELCREKSIADDQASDYALWPAIETAFRERRLFWFQTHPTWSFYRGLCGQIARDLGVGLSENEVEIGLDHLDDRQPWAHLATPIHPAVAQHFGLAWSDEHSLTYWNAVEGLVTHRQFIERYLRCQPDDNAYRGYWRSTHAKTLDDRHGAEHDLRKAIQLRPTNGWLRLLAGINLAKQGEPRAREALEQLEAAAEDVLVAQQALVHTWLGHIRANLKNHDGAIAAYCNSLARSDNASLRLRLARLFHENGQIEDAIEQWQLVLRRNPSNARVLASLGRAYAKKGRGADAVEYYERAIGCGDDSRVTLLGYLLAKAKMSGLQALKNDTSRIVLQPDDPPRLVDLCRRVSQAHTGHKPSSAQTRRP